MDAAHAMQQEIASTSLAFQFFQPFRCYLALLRLITKASNLGAPRHIFFPFAHVVTRILIALYPIEAMELTSALPISNYKRRSFCLPCVFFLYSAVINRAFLDNVIILA
ncbi:hypothetical protein ACJX0J_027347 [Zea mays]